MLIEDFLSVNNFYFLFQHLQDYAREKLNYQYEMNKKNKKEIGKLMEVIYENNHNTMDKKTANAIIISEFKKKLKKLSNETFFDNEKVHKLDKITELRPLIDYNKPNDLMPKQFKSIFKNQAKEIDSHFITERSNNPQKLFYDVIKNLEFKDHDLSQAPINERIDMLIPQPDIFKGIFDTPILIENVVMFLDSRDRNFDKYQNSHQYQIKLDSVLKNVISVELLQATIPNSDYLVHESNNTIHFQETSGTTLTASIPIGDYTSGSDIAIELENSMNNIGNSNYTVTYDDIENIFTLSSDRTGGNSEFLLKFKGIPEVFGSNNVFRTKYLDTSIGKIIGFEPMDLSNKSTHTSNNYANLFSNRNVYLYINANQRDSFDNIEGIKNSDFGKFMKIPLTSSFGENTYWINPRSYRRNMSNVPKTNKGQKIPEKSEANQINRNENDCKLYFNPPITIDTLNIEFKNYNNNYFNFHGLNHSLMFRIEMFNFHYENILQDYNQPMFENYYDDEETVEKVEIIEKIIEPESSESEEEIQI